MTNDEDRMRARRIQSGWVDQVNGDRGASDLARVLRVLGTRNFKTAHAPDSPEVRFIRTDLDRQYELRDLSALVAENGRSSRATRAHSCNVVDDAAQAAAALDGLRQSRCDDYQPWVQVGMALSELGETGLALWKQWSQKSAKYQPGDCERKWPTFVPGNGITLGSLIHWANKDSPKNGSAQSVREPTQVQTHDIAGKLRNPSAAERVLLSFDGDDEGNAQAVKHLCGDWFLHCEAYGWMYYTGTHWERDGAEAKVEWAIVSTLKRRRALAVQAEKDQLVKATKPSALSRSEHQVPALFASGG